MDSKPAATDRQRAKEAWIKKIRNRLGAELRERVPDKLRVQPGDSRDVRDTKERLLGAERNWASMTPEQRATEWAITRAKQALTVPTYHAWAFAGMPCRARLRG